LHSCRQSRLTTGNRDPTTTANTVHCDSKRRLLDDQSDIRGAGGLTIKPRAQHGAALQCVVPRNQRGSRKYTLGIRAGVNNRKQQWIERSQNAGRQPADISKSGRREGASYTEPVYGQDSRRRNARRCPSLNIQRISITFQSREYRRVARYFKPYRGNGSRGLPELNRARTSCKRRGK
jgi:hypothetical protein